MHFYLSAGQPDILVGVLRALSVFFFMRLSVSGGFAAVVLLTC